MGEILSIFGIFALGFILGWIFREEIAKRRIDKLLDELEGDVEETVNASIVKIKIENHNGAYYVFNEESDEFMAQGMTRKELEDALAKNFPEKNFMATPANLKELGWK